MYKWSQAYFENRKEILIMENPRVGIARLCSILEGNNKEIIHHLYTEIFDLP